MRRYGLEPGVIDLAKIPHVCYTLPRAAQQAMPVAAPPSQPPGWLITPEVHPDRRVRFRFRAPNAREVKLAREGTEPIAMQKDDTGVWSVTTAPLPPDTPSSSTA
jgi:hypothetical protein